MISSNILFLFSMIMSTLIVISSSSWFCIWMGLEINMMSFIPLLHKTKNKLNMESSIKYFMVQSFASMIMLMSIMTNLTEHIHHMISPPSPIIITAAMIKMGAAPFHMWYPSVMEGIEWPQIILLMTWQKIAPLFICSLSNTKILLITAITASAIIGTISAFNQTSMRKIMAYSSITHLSWMMSSIMIKTNTWLIYMMVYFITSTIVVLNIKPFNIYHTSQMYKITSTWTTIMLILNLLSMGGFPPLMGFIGKWMILNEIMNHSSLIPLILILSSWVNLYIYMRIIHPTMHLTPTTLKIHNNMTISFHIPILTLISMTSLPMLTLVL